MDFFKMLVDKFNHYVGIFGCDKFLHFLVEYAVVAQLYMVKPIFGFFAFLGLSALFFLKESRVDGTPDYKDALWSTMGGFSSLIISSMLKMFC
jgi:hypothetical protein